MYAVLINPLSKRCTVLHNKGQSIKGLFTLNIKVKTRVPTNVELCQLFLNPDLVTCTGVYKPPFFPEQIGTDRVDSPAAVHTNSI